ncbi:MAG: transketolase [Flavobacteriales bacterium]|nr:transketolase [Flavobacteriales bacterium]
MKSAQQLKEIVSQVRRDIVRMVHGVQSGHPGGSLGCAEFLTVLYHNIMDYSAMPFNKDGKNEDVFILSNGHISPVFYSTLAHAGYFDKNELGTFRKLDSRLQGHPATEEGLPGIRIATGSLGQGLSVAVGIAQSKKLNNDSHFVYALMGDGELQEGQNWEAIMYAGHYNVNNLIATVDFNKQQIDGSTTDIMGFDDLKNKFESFGWQTLTMNGNDVEDVQRGLTLAKEKSANGKPVAIIMKTEMGNGVDFMMGSHEWHGIAPNNEQLASALNQNPETLGDY